MVIKVNLTMDEVHEALIKHLQGKGVKVRVGTLVPLLNTTYDETPVIEGFEALVELPRE